MRKNMWTNKQKHPATDNKKVSPVFNRKQGAYLKEASLATEQARYGSDENFHSDSGCYKDWLNDSYSEYHSFHPSCFSKYRWRKNSRSWKDQTKARKQWEVRAKRLSN